MTSILSDKVCTRLISMLLALAIAVSALTVPMTVARGDDRSPLKVGINKNMPPFSFFDHKVSRYRGFCVDLARLLGRGLQLPIRFMPMSEHQLSAALSSGQIDFICGYIEPEQEAPRFHYINTTVNVERGFFVNKNCLTVTCAKDLTGQMVAMEKGYNLGDYLDDPNMVRFIETPDQETALIMVSAGAAKAFISHNAMTTRYIIQKNNYVNIKEVGIPLDATPLSMIARNEDSQLISEMSFAYGQLIAQRNYQILVDKWFGRSLALNLWDRYMRSLVAILSLIGVVFLIFVFLNRSLKRRVKKVTQDLQRSEKRYRELIESSPDMITMTDRRGNIILANQRTRDLLGYRPEEMASLTMIDLVDHVSRNEMNGFFSEVFEGGTANGSFKIHTKTNATIYLEIVARTIQHEAIDREMACFFCRDITQRKQLEEELIQSERLAVMGQMVAGLAHEINNPLGIILANTEEILYGNSKLNEDRECLQAIERNAERAAEIIDKLLSFTRPGQSKKSHTDATLLVEEAIFFLRQKLKHNNVRVETDYESSPMMIYADENQFQQVVINFMLNSIEAMPDGGTLNASLSTDSRGKERLLVLIIKDNGPGIPNEELNKIFNPFFTARKRKGFGLGLFISKGIVENHKGSISAVSREGEGTTIRVELPLSPKDEPEQRFKMPIR